MKSNRLLPSIMLGAIVGTSLCFAFYRITGLQNPRFFADVTLWRKLADLVCLVAFMTLGIQLAQIFLRLVFPPNKL